ncbi:hypothetical protein ACN2A0_01580 [Aerococcus viridans]|uniref:Uncharacterized protein n=1 Tax=Aerococcus urinaeequi TaxID=51665 RepID=A0A7M1KV27_9LACT|nr:hypothetical protein [Aerococcus urinaeequi]QOQ79965.1 hypothetical protein IMX20_04655 [Aerococcus urinaeequi]
MQVSLDTLSGQLTVTCNGDQSVMAFPFYKLQPVSVSEAIVLLSVSPKEAWAGP